MIEGIQISTLFYDLGRWAGIIGFTFLSILIISGDTARFFDRFFGLDKIIKFQRKFSLVTAFFILSHPSLFILAGNIGPEALIPSFAFTPLAVGGMAAYIFIAVLIASILYKRVSYRAWQYIHIITYALFFFALYHAFNLGSDSGTITMRALYMILTTGVVIGLIYRTQYKLRERYSDGFYVKEVKWETKDTFTLTLETKKDISFEAGQFFFLRLNKNKLHGRHPFTAASGPHEKDLRFTIKDTGRFTKIASQLKVGEEVIVDGPFGIFTKKNNKKDLVFIAGGVGITPFMSMIRDQVHSRSDQKITLLYGSKTEEDIIFEKELDEIKDPWLKKTYILSDAKDTSSEKFEYGYLTKDLIEKRVDSIENSLFYICGPEPMKKSAVKILKELGVKSGDIFIEDFFW